LNSKISDKDKKDWENFLSSDENLPDKDFNLKKKIKKIVTFDLHGYSLDEANIKIKNLIYDSYNKKVGKLIIVTGKGLHSQNEKDPYTSKDLGKIILCDVQKEIYPNLETAFLNLLHNSGYPGIKFEKKIDFEQLYNQRFN
tara:strand:- start:4626 stop:5048 length:423 start_codon:yes stop_codon:yes gene_type:complete